MSNITAQGSITIQRIKTGQTLGLYFDLNGKQLGQVYSLTDNKCVPDWTVAANQVTITPKVEVISGGTGKPTVSAAVWKYQGQQIIFPSGGGVSTSHGGAFKFDNATKAVTIIKNLASPDNLTNDTLEFSCEANIDGVGYTMTKSIDIILQGGGASSYLVSLSSSTGNFLNQNNTETILTTLVSKDGVAQTNFTCKWYKQNNGTMTVISGQTGKTLAVNRDMIDGTTMIKCEVYENASATTPLGAATITLTDGSDEYKVELIVEGNSTLSVGNNVTVKAYLFNQKTNAYVTVAGVVWQLGKYDPSNLKQIGSLSNTNTITLSVSDSDATASKGDVIVMAQATWTE